MKKTTIILILFTFFLCKVTAQILIQGKVYVADKPKGNVTVYLNHTTKGTTTNNNGEFSLEVKSGVYELIISHLGYKTINYDIDTSEFNGPLIFRLTEEEIVLDEVVVNGKQNNDEWKYNLSVFLNEFIGTSSFSAFCTLQNPEVLSFEYDAENNTLIAEASAPLHIRNEALGYDIIYDLKYFRRREKTASYLGYAYFKSMKGKKSKQKRWKKNRLKTYHGSQIHFYKCIISNTVKEEGFVIDLFVRKKNTAKPSPKEVLKARKLLLNSKVKFDVLRKIHKPKNAIDSAVAVLQKSRLPEYVDYLYKADLNPSEIIHKENRHIYLELEHCVRMTYLREKEEKGYILKNSKNKLRKPVFQTSNIIPLTQKNLIDPLGILANPLNILYEGYWSYEKFAHALPLDYQP